MVRERAPPNLYHITPTEALEIFYGTVEDFFFMSDQLCDMNDVVDITGFVVHPRIL